MTAQVTERELVRLKAVDDTVAEYLKAWKARPFDPKRSRAVREKLETLVLPVPEPVRERVRDARLPYRD